MEDTPITAGIVLPLIPTSTLSFSNLSPKLHAQVQDTTLFSFFLLNFMHVSIVQEIYDLEPLKTLSERPLANSRHGGDEIFHLSCERTEDTIIILFLNGP